MNYILLGLIALMIAAIVFGLVRKAKGFLISAIIFLLIFSSGSTMIFSNHINPVQRLNDVFDWQIPTSIKEFTSDIKDNLSTAFDSVFGSTETPEVVAEAPQTNLSLSDYYVEPLALDTSSSTTEGAVKYGAITVLGDLDTLGRSTFAHIRLKESHEPGMNGEKREERINVDPIGWKNFKIDGNWANNRCHLIGYQFSGLNDELRNLSIGTAYLNKGTEGNGMKQDNPDGMLFYEQALDKWLSENPTMYLDLYVQPIYEGDNTTPYVYYMQWVGFNDTQEVAISIGGYSETIQGNTQGVVLLNQSPSYVIDYTTGNISAK